jgi:hypothetical protein
MRIISKDTTWSGEVYLERGVQVAPGIKERLKNLTL